MILKGTIGGSKYQKAPWMATYSDYNYHYIITIFSSRSWGDCFLVGGLEHVLFVPSYWEFCHPNWLNWPIFFRGVGQPPTSIIYIYIYIYTSHFHQYNYGKSPFFMGKSPFLMGKKVFFSNAQPLGHCVAMTWPWPDGFDWPGQSAGGLRKFPEDHRGSPQGGYFMGYFMGYVRIIFIHIYIYVYIYICIYIYTYDMYIYIYMYCYILYDPRNFNLRWLW